MALKVEPVDFEGLITAFSDHLHFSKGAETVEKDYSYFWRVIL